MYVNLKAIIFLVIFQGLCSVLNAQNNSIQNPDKSLKGSTKLLENGDLSSMMTKGIDRFLERELLASINGRSKYLKADFTNPDAYNKSIQPNRKRLEEIIGVTDFLDDEVKMEYISTLLNNGEVSENEHFKVYTVRWHVFGDIYGEGLLLHPNAKIKARVLAIPDADQNPEMLTGLIPGLPVELQYARRLAENGCQVIIPVIIDRSAINSGSKRLDRFTNQPHREWIYRQAFTFGRHIIGYEVQKIRAAINWFEQQNQQYDSPIGLLGWAEGGLLGFYTSAIDSRIDATLVSGYFGKRERIWEEPIYRNLFGLLREFGDAEIASLIAPRNLLIEYSQAPDIKGPPIASTEPVRLRASAAPGLINTPKFTDVNSELIRAKQLSGPFSTSIQFLHNQEKELNPLNENTILIFLQKLIPDIKSLTPSGKELVLKTFKLDLESRQIRQLNELEHFTQRQILSSAHVRDEFFWNKTKISSPEEWKISMKPFQNFFWDKVIGRIPPGQINLNPQSRQIIDETKWIGYEVKLDVLQDVYAWGYLLLPKDLKPGERRPVVVTQHGAEGLPEHLLDKNNKVYKGFSAQLAERGYIVFIPHFPWRGGHEYRVLQRKANPLGLSIFSFILNQHERILDWLTTQPWVDPNRIGFYGLSWGGKVAIRVPSLLERYSLSISSGDFNEWIWKNATTDWPNSYMFAPEYEMFDFNLARTFNYAEMAAMIAPRPFMVERGHNDGVGIDEWVAFEYSKVNRLYNKLNIPEKTRIEYFNGGHEINAKGTFEFIKQQFNWPLE
jgi:dienelactone hydrolase